MMRMTSGKRKSGFSRALMKQLWKCSCVFFQLFKRRITWHAYSIPWLLQCCCAIIEVLLATFRSCSSLSSSSLFRFSSIRTNESEHRRFQFSFNWKIGMLLSKSYSTHKPRSHGPQRVKLSVLLLLTAPSKQPLTINLWMGVTAVRWAQLF